MSTSLICSNSSVYSDFCVAGVTSMSTYISCKKLYFIIITVILIVFIIINNVKCSGYPWDCCHCSCPCHYYGLLLWNVHLCHYKIMLWWSFSIGWQYAIAWLYCARKLEDQSISYLMIVQRIIKLFQWKITFCCTLYNKNALLF